MRKPARVPLDLRTLGSREPLLRIGGGVRHDPAVDAWLDDPSVPWRSLAKHCFQQFRACGDEVVELLHDGCPVACVGDVPFGYVNTFSRHVNVGFFVGAALPDPGGLLEGTGKRMRHVKLLPAIPVNDWALRKLIDAAYADIRERLRHGA